MKITIDVPPGLVPRIEALKARLAYDDADARLVEISILTRGVRALELQQTDLDAPMEPALLGDVEPAGKLGGTSR